MAEKRRLSRWGCEEPWCSGSTGFGGWFRGQQPIPYCQSCGNLAFLETVIKECECQEIREAWKEYPDKADEMENGHHLACPLACHLQRAAPTTGGTDG